MPDYRLHDPAGDDLGLLEHPAPNVEPGDVVLLAERREALVTARVETQPGGSRGAARGRGRTAAQSQLGLTPRTKGS